MKWCVAVPTYNNPDTIAPTLAAVTAFGAPVVVVDDGSDAAAARAVDAAAGRHPNATVIHRPRNGGKGAAVKDALFWAADNGFSHAVQIDADLQHDPQQIPRFVDAARRHPDALILGTPVFPEDTPRARLWGRKLSIWWVHVETLGRHIADPLFGFRVYPVDETVAILQRAAVGDRMDFDPEIAVRLVWRGVPVVNVPTAVRYHADGTSSYRMVRDNARISWMHTRLFLGMLLRAPVLVARKFR